MFVQRDDQRGGDMSGWQPARVRQFHSGPRKFPAPISKEELKRIKRSIVRIRETKANADFKRHYEEDLGCDAARFFVIHPEDTKVGDWGEVLVCEHEILTD
jgi:hypothetical protein